MIFFCSLGDFFFSFHIETLFQLIHPNNESQGAYIGSFNLTPLVHLQHIFFKLHFFFSNECIVKKRVGKEANFFFIEVEVYTSRVFYQYGFPFYFSLIDLDLIKVDLLHNQNFTFLKFYKKREEKKLKVTQMCENKQQLLKRNEKLALLFQFGCTLLKILRNLSKILRGLTTAQK